MPQHPLLRDKLEALLDVLLEVGQARREELLLLLGEVTKAVNLLNTVRLDKTWLALKVGARR